MSPKKIPALPLGMILLMVLACSFAAPSPQSDANAFNTMVAQTAQAAQIQAAAAKPPPSGPTAPPPPP